MTRSRLLFFVLSAALVVPILTGTLLAASTGDGQTQGDDSLYKYLSVFTEVLQRVRETYVEETDLDTLMGGALDGTADALDPFSLYIPAKEVDRYLAMRTIGSRRSGLTLLVERGVAYIVAVEPGSPAAAAGIKRGDIVAKIQGRSTRAMPLWEIEEILAGDPGTHVAAELLRGGETMNVGFDLQLFSVPAVATETRRGTMVAHLHEFAEATAAQMEAALKAAAEGGQERLLLDLRGVAAGDAEAAYATAGLFTDGELGQLKGRKETVQRFASQRPPVWHGRLVVLIDRGTLGPAEVLATVLKQKLGVRLVGERSFGYAGRQSLVGLDSGGRLLLTDAFYTGPDGEALRKGLVPDVPVDERSRSLATSDTPIDDLILERGLKLLEEEPPAAKAAA